MILNSPTRVFLLSVALVFLQFTQDATSMQLRKLDENNPSDCQTVVPTQSEKKLPFQKLNDSMTRHHSILAVARLNGLVKEIGGVKYQLVAIRFNSSAGWRIRDAAYSVWLINGLRMRDVTPAEHDYARSTNRFDDPPGGLSTRWMRLPATGKLEILFGVIDLSDGQSRTLEDNQLLRKELVKKFVPYSVDIDELPDVTADSLQKLQQEMKQLSHQRPRATIYSVAHVNGRSKMVAGARYLLMATHYDTFLSLQIGNAIVPELGIRGDMGGGKVLNAQADLELDGKLPHGLRCDWVKAKVDEKLEFRYGLVSYPLLKRGEDRDAALAELFIRHGTIAFTVVADKLPKIQTKTSKELVAKMHELLAD